MNRVGLPSKKTLQIIYIIKIIIYLYNILLYNACRYTGMLLAMLRIIIMHCYKKYNIPNHVI